MPTFHTITLGCKLNQFDGAALEGELVRRGYRPSPALESASVVIVNTCTVTGKADAEARRRIRRARRLNPDCRLLVTGCYAESDADALRRLGVIDRIFGNGEKLDVETVFDELGLGRPSAAGVERADRGCEGALALPGAPLHFAERTRAFLKIQEGCNLVCSYCIIPQVRGASRSVAPSAIVGAARSLFTAGHPEIVLTGVNTGDYGKDLTPPTRLADLLGRLLDGTPAGRFRLNSLEPLAVTDEIIGLMADEPRLAPHLQVPLQSGSEPVLRRMRRNYRTRTYRERIERLERRVPGVGLGADVIVGFPGETDADFDETYRFIADSPLSYLHVFAWSPRPGTDAERYGSRVHGSVIRERSARLRALADEKGRAFRYRFIGRELEAVVLGADDRQRMRALTGNFIEVRLPATAARRGAAVRVRIDAVDDDAVRATALGPVAWSA